MPPDSPSLHRPRNGQVPPRWIYSDDDPPMVLAATLGAALDEARRYNPLDHITGLVFEGWATEVGWNAEEFDSREEFERLSGYSSWWEIMGPPAHRQVTPTCIPAWTPIYCAGCDECAEDAAVTGQQRREDGER